MVLYGYWREHCLSLKSGQIAIPKLVNEKYMLLSVIVPLYNSEPYIRKCLDSLLHQDIPHSQYEIICVNDESPDNSYQLVQEEYTSKYENIHLFSQKNQGTSGARNTGIKKSHGKYLAFIDPDDYVQENVFGQLIQRMDCDNLDILRFAYTMVDEQYKVLPMPKNVIPVSSFSDKVDDGKSFLCNELGYSCFCWAYFYKASLIKDKQLYFSPGVYLDDTDWLPFVLYHAKRVSSIPISVNFYLIREGSLIHGKNQEALRKKIEGSFQMIDILKNRRCEVTETKVKEWYKGMESFLVFSMLKDIFSSLYAERKAYLEKLKEKKVFPLRYVGETAKSKLSLFLINISPTLFSYFYRNFF